MRNRLKKKQQELRKRIKLLKGIDVLFKKGIKAEFNSETRLTFNKTREVILSEDTCIEFKKDTLVSSDQDTYFTRKGGNGMAAKGSCVSSILRRGNILGLKWKLTGDSNGDADENASADVEWFLGPVYGEVVGVEVEYTDATTGYDLYVKDHQGIDILKGQGVGLINSAVHATNRFCPTNKSQDIGTATNAQGSPIILWNETLEAIGDDMGNGLISAITVYVRMFPRHDMHAVH